jgi:hypothetical protein
MRILLTACWLALAAGLHAQTVLERRVAEIERYLAQECATTIDSAQVLRLALRQFDADPFPLGLAALRLGFSALTEQQVQMSSNEPGMRNLNSMLGARKVDDVWLQLEQNARKSSYIYADDALQAALFYALLEPVRSRWGGTASSFASYFAQRVPAERAGSLGEKLAREGLTERYPDLVPWLQVVAAREASRTLPDWVLTWLWIGGAALAAGLLLPPLFYWLLIGSRLRRLREDYRAWRAHQERMTKEYEGNIRALRSFLEQADRRPLEPEYKPEE